MKESKFHLWRATFSLIHLDNKVTSGEHAWLMDRYNLLSFTEGQKKVIDEDLAKKRPIIELLGFVINPADKAFLLHQVRIISNLDNDYSPKEKIFFETLEESIMSGIDLSEFVVKAKAMEMREIKEMSISERIKLALQKLSDNEEE